MENPQNIIRGKGAKSTQSMGPWKSPIWVILETHSEVWAFLLLREAKED
jgi:hypothetical protein